MAIITLLFDFYLVEARLVRHLSVMILRIVNPFLAGTTEKPAPASRRKRRPVGRAQLRRCYRPAVAGPRRSISGSGTALHRRRYVAPFRTFMTSAGRKQATEVPPARRTLG